MEKQNIFEILRKIDVSGHIEKKNNLSYLSWAWAVDEISKKYPSFSYEVIRFENNLPYVYDPKTGYMVFTKVSIEGVTKEMWLPVMDSNNKAMLDHAYEYETKYGKKKVEICTMFDINKTIMRCLAKNIAMFGLGLYIYAGEDLPESGKDNTENVTAKKASEVKKTESQTKKEKPKNNLPSEDELF